MDVAQASTNSSARSIFAIGRGGGFMARCGYFATALGEVNVVLAWRNRRRGGKHPQAAKHFHPSMTALAAVRWLVTSAASNKPSHAGRRCLHWPAQREKGRRMWSKRSEERRVGKECRAGRWW